MIKSSQRTKQYYETLGYRIQSVEKWIERTKQRIDLFHFGDLLMFKESEDCCYLIQSCSADRRMDHEKELLSNELAKEWVQSGNRKLILISWKKKAQRDPVTNKVLKNKDGTKKQHTWQSKIEELTAEDFEVNDDQEM